MSPPSSVRLLRIAGRAPSGHDHRAVPDGPSDADLARLARDKDPRAATLVWDRFTIHHDTSVLQEPGCISPGTPCKTCDDCAGTTPACKGGTCAACASNGDCCAPLECDIATGRCELPIE